MVRPFVGRRDELERLDAVRRSVIRHHGSVTLVGGSAGIGKSRLLAEFLAGLTRRRVTVARSECLEYGGSTLGPIRALVRGLSPEDGVGIDALAEAAIEREVFFRSVESVLIEASSKRAIFACIEDLHWAEPATLEFLAFLAPHLDGRRIAILATFRDDELERDSELAERFGRVARAATVDRIALRPLGDAEILELLRTIARGAVRADEELLRRIALRAAGNPFYAEELLASSGEGGAGALPVSIRGSVLARFGRLTESHKRVVSYAAILGVRFDPAFLATILETEIEVVARALREARDQALVVEEPSAPLPFRFTHALVHEAIAASVLELEARPLHARVARILESLEHRDRRLGEIAYHWWMARDVARALATNEAAGDAAMALHAAGDAVPYYERALSVADTAADARRLALSAGGAALAHGDFSRALVSYERALASQIADSCYGEAAESIRKVAACLTYAGRDFEARERIETFVTEHRARLSDVEARVLEGYPILVMLGGGGARMWLEGGHDIDLDAVSDPASRWMLAFLEVNARAYVGDATGWTRAVTRLREAPAATGRNAALARMAIAVTAAFAGTDRAFARESLAEALTYLRSVGLESMQRYVWASETFSCYLAGDVRAARDAADRALGEGYDTNQRANVAPAGALVGLDLGDARLTELATDARMFAPWSRDQPSHSTALTATGIARHLMSAGRADEARVILERAVLALETLFATQLLLPMAARFVTSRRVRERLDALIATAHANDAAALATAEMVRATFASREGAPEARELARAAARRYAALEWPLLEAQALEIAGQTRAARDLYLRCGCIVPARRTIRDDDDSGLTSREREIAALVTAGLGNGEIAARLGLSTKTVEKHMSNIFRRLGMHSRAQVAAFVARSNGAT